MKGNIRNILNKEFTRFFKDSRMIFAMLMPGIMIFVMYSFFVPLLVSAMIGGDGEKPIVYVIDLPDSVADEYSALDIRLIPSERSDIESLKLKIAEDEAQLLLVFPKNFDRLVSEYDIASAEAAPNAEIYYNTASIKSSQVYSEAADILDTYEKNIANKFDYNRDIDYDLASEEDTTGQIFSNIMPMLLMMLLFTSCMSFAPDAIAGEKERGTIATMMVTPVKRHEIVVGKVLAFSVVSILGGTVSFLGTALSLPNVVAFAQMGVSAAAYSALDYLLLFTVIITTVLFMISIVSVISTFAKTVREAASLLSPFMIVVMLISILSLVGGKAATGTPLFAIPFYNSVLCINGIFSFDYEPINILVTNGANLLYSCLLVFAVTKMFNSERIMFSR